MTTLQASVAVSELLGQLTVLLPTGRQFAIRGRDLADELGIAERTLRSLVDELIDRGWCVGSVCSGDRPGYFLCADEHDVEAGVAHLVSRARSMHVRVARLRASAMTQFGPTVLRLFDLDEVGP